MLLFRTSAKKQPLSVTVNPMRQARKKVSSSAGEAPQKGSAGRSQPEMEAIAGRGRYDSATPGGEVDSEPTVSVTGCDWPTPGYAPHTSMVLLTTGGGARWAGLWPCCGASAMFDGCANPGREPPPNKFRKVRTGIFPIRSSLVVWRRRKHLTENSAPKKKQEGVAGEGSTPPTHPPPWASGFPVRLVHRVPGARALQRHGYGPKRRVGPPRPMKLAPRRVTGSPPAVGHWAVAVALTAGRRDWTGGRRGGGGEPPPPWRLGVTWTARVQYNTRVSLCPACFCFWSRKGFIPLVSPVSPHFPPVKGAVPVFPSPHASHSPTKLPFA